MPTPSTDIKLAEFKRGGKTVMVRVTKTAEDGKDNQLTVKRPWTKLRNCGNCFVNNCQHMTDGGYCSQWLGKWDTISSRSKTAQKRKK